MGRILAVDDQTEILWYLLMKLEQKGHTVTCATSGEQALKIVDLYPPDLILLDLKMPGMNGLEVCDRLKKSSKTRTVPVMIFTSYDSEENLVRSLEYHADWFCSKENQDFERDIYPVVEALLKRTYPDGKEPKNNVIRVGKFLMINLLEHIVLFNNRTITDMPKKLFDLLTVFAKRPHDLLGYEYLEKSVWRFASHRLEALDEQLDILVHRLKKRLGGEAAKLFPSAIGQGYRLLPEESESKLEMEVSNPTKTNG